MSKKSTNDAKNGTNNAKNGTRSAKNGTNHANNGTTRSAKNGTDAGAVAFDRVDQWHAGARQRRAAWQSTCAKLQH
jgi:hypothetical protein